MVKENIQETRQCKHCGKSFDITDKDVQFYDKISPSYAGVKCAIPLPTFCPDCRYQRRLTFRNERRLYHRPCNKTGKTIVSMFAPDKPYTVYAAQERYSDSRDGLDYGRGYIPTQSFFTQFDALLKVVPQIALLGLQNQNCDYNSFGGYSKNCYLCFDYGWNEDSAYLARTYKCKNCFDLSYCSECELSSNLSDCNGCVKCDFCIECDSSFGLQFCANCTSCNNCFMCTNLVNKQYYIENTSYTKEDYETKVQAMKAKPTQDLFSDLLIHRAQAIHAYANIVSCENVQGDYLKNCKNCKQVYGAKNTEDCAYVIEPMIANNVHDDVFSGNSCSFTLETIGCEGLSSSAFCFGCRSGSSNLLYCHFCIACHHCFGCAELRNKQYCIFNKQYTQAEYEALVPQIIQDMQTRGERGEFFPSTISPFSYNESLGQEYYPLTREQALAQGFTRMDQEQSVTVPAGMIVLKPHTLAPRAQIGDEILQQAISCEVSGRPFRIIKSELDYYKAHDFDLPTKHPDQRHYARMALRNPRKLWERNCMKCGAPMQTSYAPEREEVVYCEQCYNKEIYG